MTHPVDEALSRLAHRAIVIVDACDGCPCNYNSDGYEMCSHPVFAEHRELPGRITDDPPPDWCPVRKNGFIEIRLKD